jgi:5-methylcytosine-specific restriction endonuclease McrA
MINCIICNKEFKPSKEKANKFCGVDCYRVSQRRGDYKRGSNRIHSCAHCGKDVVGRNKGKSLTGKKCESIFCDRDCYDKHRTIIREKELSKTCDYCGVKFISHNKTGKYCSNKCRIDKGYDLVVEKHGVKGISEDGKKYIKECKICTNNFLVAKQKAYYSVCSKECISEMYKTDKKRKEKISKAFSGEKHPNYVNGCSYNNRLRGKKENEIFSKADKENVYELFNNKCFKCGATDNLALDHHIPFSRGGRLTIANTVVLCMSCNSSKNAKMPEDFYSKAEIKELKKYGIDEDSIFNKHHGLKY